VNGVVSFRFVSFRSVSSLCAVSSFASSKAQRREDKACLDFVREWMGAGTATATATPSAATAAALLPPREQLPDKVQGDPHRRRLVLLVVAVEMY
jgi:hypothetical protein